MKIYENFISVLSTNLWSEWKLVDLNFVKFSSNNLLSLKKKKKFTAERGD